MPIDMLSYCSTSFIILAILVESFSPNSPSGSLRRSIFQQHRYVNLVYASMNPISLRLEMAPIQDSAVELTVNHTETSASNLDEGQVILACRAYLRKTHKLEWEGKKKRKQAAASPLFNEGYFWHDPKELLYLKQQPDPCNLFDNRNSTEYSNDDLSDRAKLPLNNPLEEDKVVLSTNPFSCNPLYPSEEHQRRSHSKDHLWRNQTWKELWYNKRWKGRTVSREYKRRKKREKLLTSIPTSILLSPEMNSLSEEEIINAIISYASTNRRKSEARNKLKKKREANREKFLQRKHAIKELASQINTTKTSLAGENDNMYPLTFQPPADIMKQLQSTRSEKARLAFRKRLDNNRSSKIAVSSMLDITSLQRNCSVDETGRDKSMLAILRINNSLDAKRTPSVVDVETILRPGRLGRRKAILRRILSECFDLRGKCVPKLKDSTCEMDDDTHATEIDNDGNVNLSFVTTSSIRELGSFVLSKLRESTDS